MTDDDETDDELDIPAADLLLLAACALAADPLLSPEELEPELHPLRNSRTPIPKDVISVLLKTVR